MRSKRRSALALIFAVLAATVAGCDSPTDTSSEQVVGVVILNAGGSQVVRFLDNGTVTGELTVVAGSTANYHVRVLTATGATVPLDGTVYSIRNPGVVISFRANIGIQGDRLVIGGVQSGSAGTVHFQLFRGASELFQVEGIPLTVL